MFRTLCSQLSEKEGTNVIPAPVQFFPSSLKASILNNAFRSDLYQLMYVHLLHVLVTYNIFSSFCPFVVHFRFFPSSNKVRNVQKDQ